MKRKTIGGIVLKKYKNDVNINLRTHVPDKYIIIDQETADVWKWNEEDKKFYRPNLDDILETICVLTATIKQE